MRRSCALALAALALNSFTQAHTARGATIAPLSQTRSVSARALAVSAFGADSMEDSAAASDYTRFDPNIAVSANAPLDLDGGGGASASAGAAQDSLILPNRIFGIGSALADAFGTSGSSAQGLATSLMSVTFTIDEAAPYRFDAFLGADKDVAPIGPSGMISLIGPGGVLLSDSITAGQPTLEVSQEGVLEPGEYTLFVSIVADALYDEFTPANSGRVDFSAELVVIPEPASFLLLASLLSLAARRRSA